MRHGIELSKSRGKEYAVFYGSILDLHMHPRIFDPIIDERPGPRGKAGLGIYTIAALRNGISTGNAMPNELRRIYSPESEDGTELIPYPITTPERLLDAISHIQQESVIPMGIQMGVDRSIIGLGINEKTPRFTTKMIEESYSNKYVKALSTGLKIYGANTTGGYNIPLECIIPVAEVYNRHNPGKPITLHLEDQDVGLILAAWPDHIPVTIAHVSSKQEMETAIIAKEDGKDVWIEVTPHHMFLTDETRHILGAGGCVKPSLKPTEDRDYLWAHKEYIDQVGSDCAPHRHEDKFGPDGKDVKEPAFGLANHTVFTRAFLEAFYEGRATREELYKWFVKNPHERLNLPLGDVATRFELSEVTAQEVEENVGYDYNPFLDSPEAPKLRGRIKQVKKAGDLMLRGVEVKSRPSYKNVIRY